MTSTTSARRGVTPPPPPGPGGASDNEDQVDDDDDEYDDEIAENTRGAGAIGETMATNSRVAPPPSTTSTTTTLMELDDETLDRIWMHGVDLWYNHGDLHQAMDNWESVVESLFPNDSLDEEDEDHVEHPLEFLFPSSTSSSSDSSMIPLDSAMTATLISSSPTNTNTTTSPNSPTAIQQLLQRTRHEQLRAAAAHIPMRLAPLLLFLSGCQLDAGQYPESRINLRRCLLILFYSSQVQQSQSQSQSQLSPSRTTFTSTTSHATTTMSLWIQNLRQRTFTEYIAAYQEDASIPEPWKVAYKIVDTVLQQQQQQQQQMGGGDPSELLQYSWTSPYQRAGFLYPLLTRSVNNKPYFEESSSDYRPAWCRALEHEYYDIIREELQQLLTTTTSNAQQQEEEAYQPRLRKCSGSVSSSNSSLHWHKVGQGDHREGAGAHDGTVVVGTAGNDSDGDWREIVLFAATGAQPHLAPRTCNIIAKHIPEAVSLAQAGGGEVVFSKLAPRTHILPHCGTTNLRLTAHLGLVIPNSTTSTTSAPPTGSARIRVADQWHTWQERKVMLFDDSYEHEVINDTDQDRIVLLIRFWHFDLQSGNDERRSILDRAIQAREQDETQRYHPPLPDAGYSTNNTNTHTNRMMMM